jgi:hypothetical protein
LIVSLVEVSSTGDDAPSHESASRCDEEREDRQRRTDHADYCQYEPDDPDHPGDEASDGVSVQPLLSDTAWRVTPALLKVVHVLEDSARCSATRSSAGHSSLGFLLPGTPVSALRHLSRYSPKVLATVHLVLSAWRAREEWQRNVRRLSVARLISRGGSQAARVAQVAIVYERTHGSGVWLAAVFFTSFACARWSAQRLVR